MDAKVTEEVSYTTIETSKKSTTTNKKILRNTWTGNAVQVNCYDSEGRLQSVETDKHSWLDTDTEAYKWTDKDTPPNIPPADKNLQIESFIVDGPQTLTKMTDNGSVLMLKSTEISTTPVVHWTGTNTQHITTSEPNDKGEVTTHPYPVASGGASQHSGDQTVVVSNTVVTGTPVVTTEVKLSENSEGQKWSRSEETVWMTSNKRINPDILAITYDGEGEAPAKPAKQIEGAAMVNGHEGLSVEERRKMRRNVSREKTAAAGGSVPQVTDPSRVRTRPVIERDY